MSEIRIELDPEALREATSQAIMGVLTPEARAKIIEAAICGLLTPSTSSWARNKSPIEIAFDNAVNRLAQEEAVKYLASDENVCEKLKALVRSTADKVLNSDPEKLAQRMADAFVSSMRRED